MARLPAEMDRCDDLPLFSAMNKGTSLFAAFGLPVPLAEHRFNPERRWRFDYAWIEQKVALEVEGGVWSGGRHARGKGFLGDMEKYNSATLLGWRVLRCTPDSLLTLATIKMLKGTLNSEKPLPVS